MFRYFDYTYCLQEDSIRFDVKISVQFAPKNHQYLLQNLGLSK